MQISINPKFMINFSNETGLYTVLKHSDVQKYVEKYNFCSLPYGNFTNDSFEEKFFWVSYC